MATQRLPAFLGTRRARLVGLGAAPPPRPARRRARVRGLAPRQILGRRLRARRPALVAKRPGRGRVLGGPRLGPPRGLVGRGRLGPPLVARPLRKRRF